MNTIGSLIKNAAGRLEQSGASDPGLDAELMFLSLTGRDRSWLFLHRDDPVDPAAAESFEEMVQERLSGRPVQYILGIQEFMGLEFAVNEAVLIPRRDTEVLVETALEKAKNMGAELSVMDMCCGSGAIAVSMACFLPGIRVTGCDISEEALETARQNADANGVAERTVFVRSDMFGGPEGDGVFPGEPFDMILCNPPYIPTDVISSLQREVKEHEPAGALDGGADGLDFYRIIAECAADCIRPGGLLMLEIGFDQADAVMRLLEAEGRYTDIEIGKDLAGLDRTACCTVTG